MMDPKIIEVPFTNELRKYLIVKGYEQILNVGVTSEHNNEAGGESAPYVLIPLKQGDEDFFEKEMLNMIEPIDNSEVIDMANGDPLIRFVIQMPTKEFEQYIKL